jgi:hypothetical protein
MVTVTDAPGVTETACLMQYAPAPPPPVAELAQFTDPLPPPPVIVTQTAVTPAGTVKLPEERNSWVFNFPPRNCVSVLM